MDLFGKEFNSLISLDSNKGRPYRVVKYDPEWVNLFNTEKERLSKVFGKTAVDIQHIGSTSVPGIWAKPQIDILVIVPNLDEVDRIIRDIKKAGYTHESDFDKFNERTFSKAKESGEKIVNVHTMTADNPQAKRYIYFREYLRSHPEERELYSKSKRDSYNEGKTDRVQYSIGKRQVLNELLERAAKWYESSSNILYPRP